MEQFIDIDGRRSIKVLRADDWVEVSGELYEAIATRRLGWNEAVEAGEGLLVIHGANRTVRYALQDFDALRDVWTAKRLSA
jgi:hypothetical protein